MAPFPSSDLRAYAAERHDVLALGELCAFDLSHDAIQYRVERRQMRRVHEGVFTFAHRLSPQGRWRAAVLACGDGHALRGRSAGSHREILRDDGGTSYVAGPAERKHEGIRHRRTALLPWEIEVVDHIPTTCVARTLVDLCANASPDRVRRLITRTERLRIYDHRQVLRVLDAHPRVPGAARLRAGLAIYAEPAATKNVLEDAMNAICDRIGRPRPLVNTLVEGVEVDFFWPHARLIAETDGRDTHLTPTAFEDDRARDAEFTARGYRVVRFTYRQVMDRPDEVARILTRLLPA